MKRDHPSPSTTCSGCGVQDPLFIHNVRFRGCDPRFCTNCVLKNHQGQFCPICLEVYDDPLPNNFRLMCLRCSSVAHRSCVLPSSDCDASPPSPAFECPPCSDPNFSFFKLDRTNASDANKSIKAEVIEGESDPVALCVRNDRNSRAIDTNSAKALVAAARIAAISMSKAAALARSVVERRAKEAALARKKAREALERVDYLVAVDNNDLNTVTSDLKGSPGAGVDRVGVSEQNKASQDLNPIGNDVIRKDGVLPALPQRN